MSVSELQQSLSEIEESKAGEIKRFVSTPKKSTDNFEKIIFSQNDKSEKSKSQLNLISLTRPN